MRIATVIECLHFAGFTDYEIQWVISQRMAVA